MNQTNKPEEKPTDPPAEEPKAKQPETAQTFERVLGAELDSIEKRRKAVNLPPKGPDEDPNETDQRRRAWEKGLVGLTFSGGGIRSATICLGILQGLASLRLLRIFDYLSTVSGGGYAGAWLASWIHREKDVANVEHQLATERERQAQAKRTCDVRDEKGDLSTYEIPKGTVLEDEPEPIHHVRAYSRYLAPEASAFGLDRWVLRAIYIRNTFVNLLVLVTTGLVLVLFMRLLAHFYHWAPTKRGTFHDILAWDSLFSVLMLVLGGICIYQIASARYGLRRGPGNPTFDRATEWIRALRNLGWVIWPLMLAAFLGGWLFTTGYSGNPVHLRHFYAEEIAGKIDSGPMWVTEFLYVVVATALFLTVAGISVLILYLRKRKWIKSTRVKDIAPERSPQLVVLLLFILGLIWGACFRLSLRLGIWNLADNEMVITFGPPLILGACLVAGYLELMVVGSRLGEYEREWRSRLGAYLLFFALLWMIAFAILFLIPCWLIERDWKGFWAALGWFIMTVIGLRSNQNQPTRQERVQGKGSWTRFVAWLGPFVFFLGFFVGLALLAALMVTAATGYPPGKFLESFHAHVCHVNPASLVPTLWLCVCSLAVTLFLCAALDSNLFSLHPLYANRLIRAFLGATRRKAHWSGSRKEQQPLLNCRLIWKDGQWIWGPGTGGAPTNADEGRDARNNDLVTGFDPHDDIALCELQHDRNYQGPYPLINTALSLLADPDLTNQDRRAASFLLAPLYCGCDKTGYATTPEGHNDRMNVSLGRAMAISGAAVDPNMAVQLLPLQVALLTVFNLRLGWWMENPKNKTWNAKAPRGIMWAGGPTVPLLKELMGGTTATDPYVRLTDGGHFDNLGTYELIKRRCRYVVACDAAEDINAASENLARTIRLVRQDFGVEIDIDVGLISKDAGGLFSERHLAVGTIRYPDIDEPGIFVFIRSSMHPGMSTDLLQYAQTHRNFPHDPTLDQFFDSDQFESYRALGEQLAKTVFHDVSIADWDNRTRTIPEIFQALQNQWRVPREIEIIDIGGEQTCNYTPEPPDPEE